jgi:hypothetical protein
MITLVRVNFSMLTYYFIDFAVVNTDKHRKLENMCEDTPGLQDERCLSSYIFKNSLPPNTHFRLQMNEK